MILALVADTPKLFGVTQLRYFLSRVLACGARIKQNTISIGEKLFGPICNIFASSECLFFHLDFQIILMVFSIILALTELIIH